MVNGFVNFDNLRWDNFIEGEYLQEFIEKFNTKYGYYPKEVLVDRIYWNRENRQFMKEKGIILNGKPLGRPPKD